MPTFSSKVASASTAAMVASISTSVMPLRGWNSFISALLRAIHANIARQFNSEAREMV